MLHQVPRLRMHALVMRADYDVDIIGRPVIIIVLNVSCDACYACVVYMHVCITAAARSNGWHPYGAALIWSVWQCSSLTTLTCDCAEYV